MMLVLKPAFLEPLGPEVEFFFALSLVEPAGIIKDPALIRAAFKPLGKILHYMEYASLIQCLRPYKCCCLAYRLQVIFDNKFYVPQSALLQPLTKAIPGIS